MLLFSFLTWFVTPHMPVLHLTPTAHTALLTLQTQDITQNNKSHCSLAESIFTMPTLTRKVSALSPLMSFSLHHLQYNQRCYNNMTIQGLGSGRHRAEKSLAHTTELLQCVSFLLLPLLKCYYVSANPFWKLSNRRRRSSEALPSGYQH